MKNNIFIVLIFCNEYVNFIYCRFLIKFEKFIIMLNVFLIDVFVRCRILNLFYNFMYISKFVFWDFVVIVFSFDGVIVVY